MIVKKFLENWRRGMFFYGREGILGIVDIFIKFLFWFFRRNVYIIFILGDRRENRLIRFYLKF